MITNKTKFSFVLASLVFALGLGVATPSLAVPSYARQTGMACQACHTVFPELTPFGRLFKLNAYQIDNLPQVQGITSSKEYELLLNQVPPLSMMFQTSYTHTSKALPDSVIPGTNSQDGQVLFPQQASLFYAGRIAPGLGAFIQITYDSASGNVHWDNTEVRYAKQVSFAAEPLTWGLTINNNPTVQDVWNSTPAWQTPFDQKTSAAPVPGAITQLDGALAGHGVAGLTGYLWWKGIYGELGFYKSSPQGFNVNGLAGPLDSTTGSALTNNAPYWRLAYEHQWDRNSISVGTYGMEAQLSPPGQALAPPSDRFRDTAFDGQYQYIGDDNIVSVQTTYIKEKQKLDGSFPLGLSENPENDLKTFRLAASYYYRRTYGGALGVFSTTGSTDAIRYAPGPTFGFANNSPNSKGWIAEVSYIPWQNVKLLAQYVGYQKFNGETNNYDGTGRNASDNNTLYLLGWLAF
ncbi:MAG TPA: cytochrome C [Burkholderiales bacterium]|nr:cytochrome C [Burkholderiales bacterium]